MTSGEYQIPAILLSKAALNFDLEICSRARSEVFSSTEPQILPRLTFEVVIRSHFALRTHKYECLPRIHIIIAVIALKIKIPSISS